MSKLFVAASLLLATSGSVVQARSWTDVAPLHGLDPQEEVSMDLIQLYIGMDPLAPPAPTASPSTASPSLQPSESPTLKPTLFPTDFPSAVPSLGPDPYPPNDEPLNPDSSYFNYNDSPGASHGPGSLGFYQVNNKMTYGYKNNAWGQVESPTDSYWNEFDDNGFGAWKGTLESRQPNRNRCDRVGMQSPIDVRDSGASCDEFHEVRSLRGDFRVAGDRVRKIIASNKLRLQFDRRPCSDLNNVTCQEPDPPHADFPNGWGGYADVMHVDFKVPSEHLLHGERFDAEMQIFHLHPGRRRLPTQSVLIRATDNGHNYYFDEALKAFEYVYDTHRGQCARKRRRERQLVSDFHNILGDKIESEFDDYTTWAEFSTEMDRPDYKEHSKQMERKLQYPQVGIWDPHHPLLVPTIWFYRYDGSLTEPPCGEWVSWFIADTPMEISKRQLEKLKTILFTHVDPDCKKTSAHFDQSVARPVQDTAGRPVWRCTPRDYGPD